MTNAYKRYALGLMTAVYTINLIDRGLIMLLLQPIKVDLQLSDTQLGFVTGIAFAFFYATVGLPIARLADRGDRGTLTASAIGLWGLVVMGTVFVGNFVQLVIARVAAAVGEAGCKPPTYSLVGDYFPKPAERARAMSIYWLGSPLAALIAFVVGGWLNEQVGWRMTFFLMGIPGLLLALLVKLTLVDPRHTAQKAGAAKPVLPPVRAVFSALWRQQASRHLSMAIILFFTLGYGMGPWYAAFLIRSHGMGTAELGLWLGLIQGVGGVIGLLLGGYVISRWFADNEAGQMRVTSIMVASLVPLFLAFLLLPEKHQALLAFIPFIVVFNFFFAPTFALLQRLVPDEMRATTLAVVMLLANLIGMGMGPQLVGVLSDLLQPSTGVDSLRYAMCIVSLIALWASYHFWRVGRTVGEDLATVTPPALNSQPVP